jgi:hypothetical protein
VSPDGSTVVYSRYFENRPPELCIVPLVGGQVVKIADGTDATWSPDGKRIGYVKSPRFAARNKAEFWTIRPDGKENHREFIDTIGLVASETVVENTQETFLFDWSPDGGAIAWLRRLPRLYCEIVAHNLTTGTESTLIADTTLKGGLCWLRNNTIVYSSSGGDGLHLRVIPGGGGAPVQITRGTGSEITPTASLDGSTVFFTSVKITQDIGIGKLDGSEPSRVAAVDGVIYQGNVDLSPANRQIVLSRGHHGLTSYTLALINYDGTNMRALTKGEDRADMGPKWSPNGEWIAYYSRRTFEPYDSFKVYLINPKTMEQPRLVFPAWCAPQWVNDSTLLVSKGWTKWFWLSLNGGSLVQIAADSILPYFVGDGKYVVYFDRHTYAQDHWRILPVARWNKNAVVDAEIFDWGELPNSIFGGSSGRNRFGIWCDTTKGDLWKVWYPDKRKEQVKGSCDLLKGIGKLNISWDETEYDFTYGAISKRKDDIVMIENLFK